MSQEELAHRSGVSVRTVRYLETGRVRRPRAGSVRLLAEALALSGAEREQFVRAAAHGAPEASPAAGSDSTGGSGEPLEPGGHPPQRDPVPRQVPAAVPNFVGRAEDLAALDRAAGTDAGPWSGVGLAAVVGVVSGTAGVGKTALVARWAHARAPHFPDGSLFVDLRGFSTEEPLPAADALALLLRGVGVAAADVPVEVDERAALYRTRLAGRRLLVVLDNAGSVEQVRPLLPGAAGPVVVVTSRDPLAGLVARDGARRVDLDLLSSEDAGALLTTLIGARAVADPAAAAHLAEQCARLPLALRVAAELAVGRAGTTLSRLVVDLADEERRLDLLDAGGDSRTAVEAVLSWSYRALPDRAARAFRAIGLHPGPHVDVAAVAALLDVDLRAAEDAIRDLCRAHLMAEVAPSRYWSHDLLHAIATRIGRDTDRTEVRETARARLFAHYTATAAQAADLAFPPRQWAFPPPPPPASSPALSGRAEALAWLDAERPVLAHPGLRPPPAMSLGLSETLSRYLYDGSHLIDAITVHERARHAARVTGDVVGRAVALRGLATIQWRWGRLAAAADLATEAVATARDAGAASLEALALSDAGGINGQQARYDEAERCYSRALELSRQHGERYPEGSCVLNLGVVHERRGQLEVAADHYRRAGAIFEEVGYDQGRASALANLAEVARQRGENTAEGDYLQAIELFRTSGNSTVLEARALDGLGNEYLRQGRLGAATDAHRRALRLFRAAGNRVGEGWALDGVAASLVAQRDPQQALTIYRQALAVFRETGDETGVISALSGLGDALRDTGAPAEAAQHYDEAAERAVMTGDRPEEARALVGLADATLLLGDAAAARAHSARAHRIHTELGVAGPSIRP